MSDFIKILVERIGYFNFIHLKDSMLFLTGLLTGILLSILLVGNLFYKLKKIHGPKEFTSMKVRNKSETSYFCNFNSYFEAVETLTILALIPFFHRKEYLIKNPMRSRKVLYVIIIITTILLILSFYFISTTILP